LILHSQTNNGVAIIKIGYCFHKPVIDILYLLSSMYQKVYIVKPHTSNVMSYEKFIVCKNFILNENVKNTYDFYIEKLIEFKNIYLNNVSNNITSKNISCLIDKDTPYFYINKIDDINNIIGQQQLETIDQVINIYKNKNKDDKIESIKKMNIQKSINWCEKMKIPYNKIYNKFSEKPNIFLPIINDDLEVEDIETDEVENIIIIDNDI
jgi:ribosomal protein L7Ae-like RNA K-turn-binding protein